MFGGLWSSCVVGGKLLHNLDPTVGKPLIHTFFLLFNDEVSHQAQKDPQDDDTIDGKENGETTREIVGRCQISVACRCGV